MGKISIRGTCLLLFFIIIINGCTFSNCNKGHVENDLNSVKKKDHHDFNEERSKDVGLSAEDYFKKAIELQRNNGFFLSTKNDTLIYLESAMLIEEAISLDSSIAYFYVNLSKIYFRLDSINKAVQVLDELLVMDSDYVEAISAQGFMLEKSGNFNKAIKRYEKALRIYDARTHKTFSEYINRAFLINLLQGKDSAVKELEDIKEKFPEEDISFFEYQFKNFDRKQFINNSLK